MVSSNFALSYTKKPLITDMPKCHVLLCELCYGNVVLSFVVTIEVSFSLGGLCPEISWWICLGSKELRWGCPI